MCQLRTPTTSNPATAPDMQHLGSQGRQDECTYAQVTSFDSEAALLDGFVQAVRALDPDIILGFEVQQGSVGFLVDRALALERPLPLLRELSRTPEARAIGCAWMQEPSVLLCCMQI